MAQILELLLEQIEYYGLDEITEMDMFCSSMHDIEHEYNIKEFIASSSTDLIQEILNQFTKEELIQIMTNPNYVFSNSRFRMNKILYCLVVLRSKETGFIESINLTKFDNISFMFYYSDYDVKIYKVSNYIDVEVLCKSFCTILSNYHDTTFKKVFVEYEKFNNQIKFFVPLNIQDESAILIENYEQLIQGIRFTTLTETFHFK
jgi:hypothetical protein